MHQTKFKHTFFLAIASTPLVGVFTLALLLLSFSSVRLCDAVDETVTVTILHTNDTYGRLQPFRLPTGEVGGLARRSYLIRKIVKAVGGQALVLDAGGAISPLPESAFEKGKSVIDIMNRAGYTAMTLGSHEFDYGLDVLQKRMSEAKFDMLSANVLLRDTGEPLAKAYIIKEINGVKFGVFGLTPPEARTIAKPEETRKLRFADPIQTAKEAVRKLKEAEKCDFVIALSHLGYADDRTLAQQVAGINLIIGGHLSAYDERAVWRAVPIEQRFFVIGMIYADLLAKLKGHFSRDVILEELTTLQLGLDALDASDAIYSYLFELENIISDDEYSEYSKAASSKVLSMLYPFIEDLAASGSLESINNLRAGQWLVDMRIVAATKNQGGAFGRNRG